MKYDDAEWHYSGDFPSSSPEAYGGTHIALFLRWCFSKGWVGALHHMEEPEAVTAVRDGSMSATTFLFVYCDGTLTDEDLNEAGNEFAQQYYGEDGLYLDDYTRHFGNLLYSASLEEHDATKFSAVLDQRLRTGILTKTQERASNRKWWHFWS
jgi:hypothetical protein